MSDLPTLQAGTHTLGPGDGWIHLNTWKQGLLSAMGHDLLLDITSFSLVIETTEDHSANVTLDISSDAFGVLEPTLSDKDKGEIHKNIRKHLPGALHFSGEVSWQSSDKAHVKGTLQLGRGRASLSFDARREGDTTLAGRVRLTHSALDLKPFRAPLGVIKVKDEIEVSFSLDLSALL